MGRPAGPEQEALGLRALRVVGEQVEGLSVQIVARIAQLALPGEILVSRTVRDLVAGSRIAFAERGAHDVAQTTERWPLYAVAGTRASHAGNPPTRSATSG